MKRKKPAVKKIWAIRLFFAGLGLVFVSVEDWFGFESGLSKDLFLPFVLALIVYIPELVFGEKDYETKRIRLFNFIVCPFVAFLMFVLLYHGILPTPRTGDVLGDIILCGVFYALNIGLSYSLNGIFPKK